MHDHDQSIGGPILPTVERKENKIVVTLTWMRYMALRLLPIHIETVVERIFGIKAYEYQSFVIRYTGGKKYILSKSRFTLLDIVYARLKAIGKGIDQAKQVDSGMMHIEIESSDWHTFDTVLTCLEAVEEHIPLISTILNGARLLDVDASKICMGASNARETAELEWEEKREKERVQWIANRTKEIEVEEKKRNEVAEEEKERKLEAQIAENRRKREAAKQQMDSDIPSTTFCSDEGTPFLLYPNLNGK
jgi:hypothetical protein